MPRAVIHDGTIVLLEPLSMDWVDGTEVDVEIEPVSDEKRSAEADAWFREMEAACADADPRDAEIIDAAIREMDHIAKEQVRREMGLP